MKLGWNDGIIIGCIAKESCDMRDSYRAKENGSANRRNQYISIVSCLPVFLCLIRQIDIVTLD